MIKGLKG